MTIELAGPAGTLQLRPDSSFTIRRGDETILAAPPTFIEVFGATFPAQAEVEQQAGPTALQATFDTAWKGLRIKLNASVEPDGFRLEWTCEQVMARVGLAFALATGGPWYGMGERTIQGWPLERFGVTSEPFQPYDFARDGTLNICTPLWLNAAGAGLLVEEDTGDLSVTVNRAGDGRLSIVQKPPEMVSTLGEPPIERPYARLPLRVLIGEHLPAARRLALNHLGRPSTAPPLDLFTRPIWTTWARYKMHITQEQTLRFADDILSHGYPYSVLEIDDRWQAQYGDLRFDPLKFPEPGHMVQQLHDRGFRVTLWVPPFINPESELFRSAAERGYLLHHGRPGSPALSHWWQGYGAVIDVSNPEALDWWLDELRHLQQAYGVDGFKFDAGEGNWIPPASISAGPLIHTSYPDQYVDFVARHFEWTEVRCGWRSQHQGIFFREWDKFSRWGADNGLHAVLTQALMLGIIGYPFVLPDMIGGNAYGDEVPDAELLIRWTQLTALLPSMQFSLAPWDYSQEVDEVCRRYARLHVELAPVLQQCVADTLSDGTPIVRPLFWHAPGDRETYTIDDQFMLGDRLLVAPVVQSGQRERSIYLPAGHWRDRWAGNDFHGPQRIDRYPAPLDVLPLFERVK